jgi:hypothetical protein
MFGAALVENREGTALVLKASMDLKLAPGGRRALAGGAERRADLP